MGLCGLEYCGEKWATGVKADLDDEGKSGVGEHAYDEGGGERDLWGTVAVTVEQVDGLYSMCIFERETVNRERTVHSVHKIQAFYSDVYCAVVDACGRRVLCSFSSARMLHQSLSFLKNIGAL